MHFEFEAQLWRWQARETDVWTFVSLPPEASDDIREVVGGMSGGFGSVRVDVRIGSTRWRTSIFPSKPEGFVLPIKKAVRAAESISIGDIVPVEIELVDF